MLIRDPLVAGQFKDHPLAQAARNLSSAEQQLVKHQDGQFEWILRIKYPAGPTAVSDSSITTSTTNQTELRTAFFGCNLLPLSGQPPREEEMKDIGADTYVLLVTPIDDDEEPIKMELRPPGRENVTSTENHTMCSTPRKASSGYSEDEIPHLSPSSIRTYSDRSSPVRAASRSPSRSSSRIEDSVEALDMLEEQLEEFDQAAHFHRAENRNSQQGRPSMQSPNEPRSRNVKAATPQPIRSTAPKTTSATARTKSSAELGRAPSIRKSASMSFFGSDSTNAKREERQPNRTVHGSSSNQTTRTRPTSFISPPKPPVKSSKPPTIPSFELPGEAVARRLKEKREARQQAQAAAEQASKASAQQASTLRRTKSARGPLIPNFQLPGEAISQRKREEREAQLRAQEEEERRRREFKARPIRSGAAAAPGSYPRETIASRARQQNKARPENAGQHHSPAHHANKSERYPNERPPLSAAVNESQTRGRGVNARQPPPAPAGASSQTSRGTSHASSAGSSIGIGGGNSVSKRRSVLSAEELEQQRLRGEVIYRKDNSLSEERMREKRERETLARIAREEAAERSRLLSREWAARQQQQQQQQARKRMTVGSLRDLARRCG